MQSIDWISIHGFKSIRLLHRLRLQPINVLIGANGSGKSNFMSAFEWLSPDLRTNGSDIPKSDRNPEKVLHRGAETSKQATLELCMKDTTRTERVRIRQDTEGRVLAGRNRTNREQTVSRTEKKQRAWLVHRFHNDGTPAMLNDGQNMSEHTALQRDARNLSGYLRHLSKEYPAEYSLIRGTVALIAPFFDRFEWDDAGNISWRQKGQTTTAPIETLSPGTIRFVALATLLQQPVDKQPSLMLIEEPDAGLHPYAMVILGALIKSAATESQIVLSTHSPTLLDEFDPEDVIIAEQPENETSLHRLEAGATDGWLDKYSLSDLWLKNMLGGRPGPGTAHQTPNL